MEIYPAVDLYEGSVVRLERGDYRRSKIYSKEPAKIAKKWADEGAHWLHVVDLEGAKTGKIKNWPSLERICSVGKVFVQFGGGVRNEKDIERLTQLGVRRVVLGTKILDASFLTKVAERLGEQVAVSLDLRGDEVQVEGWLKGGNRSVYELLSELKNCRIGCVIVTDIERDGTLGGIDLPKMRRILTQSPLPMIFSGGVSSLGDVRSLVSLGQEVSPSRLQGVIIGKALYEGRFDLKAALEIARGGRMP